MIDVVHADPLKDVSLMALALNKQWLKNYLLDFINKTNNFETIGLCRVCIQPINNMNT